MWSDFDHARPSTSVFVASLIVTLVLFSIIHRSLDRAVRRGGAPLPAPRT